MLIIGIPFFLAFIGIARAISLGEGRLIEAMSGERMPRRPVHPGPQQGVLARIGAMLKDSRTWTTLAYLMLMLPLGIIYFVVAVVGLSVGLIGVFAVPLALLGPFFDAFGTTVDPAWLGTPPALLAVGILGILVLTSLLHTARGIGRVHAHIAKRFLVTPS